VGLFILSQLQGLCHFYRACSLFLCVYTYSGLADPDEVAFACSIALQAYFEGRAMTREDMDSCIKFWRDNVSEEGDPIGRKRPVMCEPLYVPCPDCYTCYQCVHPRRDIPYGEDEMTDRLKEVSWNACRPGKRYVNCDSSLLI